MDSQEHAWESTAVAWGEWTDKRGVFAYILQVRLPEKDTARIKLSRDGVRVVQSAPRPRDVFSDLENNFSSNRELGLVGENTVQLPNGVRLQVQDERGADASGNSLVRSAYWGATRLVERIRAWEDATESKIAKINSLITSMNNLPV
jgi:hypothetical protein